MAKIYTKIGDHGQTSLIGGHQVIKSDIRIEVYGTIDELNSTVGFIRSECQKLIQASPHFQQFDHEFETIQHWLFDLGSLFASTPKDREKYKLATIKLSHIEFLEKSIDLATSQLPALKNFILPGGSELSSRLHIARTITRRTERLIVDLDQNIGETPENSIAFMNRLSDYFFVMARLANLLENRNDVLWKHGYNA